MALRRPKCVVFSVSLLKLVTCMVVFYYFHHFQQLNNVSRSETNNGAVGTASVPLKSVPPNPSSHPQNRLELGKNDIMTDHDGIHVFYTNRSYLWEFDLEDSVIFCNTCLNTGIAFSQCITALTMTSAGSWLWLSSSAVISVFFSIPWFALAITLNFTCFGTSSLGIFALFDFWLAVLVSSIEFEIETIPTNSADPQQAETAV